MEKLFYQDEVSIIRKEGDSYIREEINTAPILAGSANDQVSIKSQVIGRLRKDPSVIVVLEDRGGRADEMITLPDGFEMAVSLIEGDTAQGSLTVFHQGEKAYEAEYEQAAEEDARDLYYELTDGIIELLEQIDHKDYSFVSDECSHFETVESGDEVDLYGARHILEKEGFQTEKIHTVGFLPAPFLFVHENEVILMGSRHFDGVTLFLEMKRLFICAKAKAVEIAVDKIGEDNVDIISHGDESWSFRKQMDEDIYTDNFIERLLSDIAVIKEVIAEVEKERGVGKEPWPIMLEQRQLFIHEVIDSSSEIQKLNI